MGGIFITENVVHIAWYELSRLFAMLLSSHLLNNSQHETRPHCANIFVIEMKSDGVDDIIIQ